LIYFCLPYQPQCLLLTWFYSSFILLTGANKSTGYDFGQAPVHVYGWLRAKISPFCVSAQLGSNNMVGASTALQCCPVAIYLEVLGYMCDNYYQFFMTSHWPHIADGCCGPEKPSRICDGTETSRCIQECICLCA
jgi:hypothetical protein